MRLIIPDFINKKGEPLNGSPFLLLHRYFLFLTLFQYPVLAVDPHVPLNHPLPPKPAKSP